jgi:uncharacterized protein (TIGR02421 family)
MIDISQYQPIDNQLLAIGRSLKVQYYIEPINGLRQKEPFLNNKIKNPLFSYKPLNYDPVSIQEKLDTIKVPDSDPNLKEIFEKEREQLTLKNQMLMHLGDGNILVENSKQLYGQPDQELVKCAEMVLKKFSREESSKVIPPNLIVMSMKEQLNRYGLTDWKVELSEKWLTNVYPAEKRLTVCKDRMFSKIDPRRLTIHEIDVHALRAANGYLQPLHIFATGLPDSLSTEEGLASYLEGLTGNTSDEMLVNYAGRVIAVASLCDDHTFRETFDLLRHYRFSSEQAWLLAVRAHRGGGYAKDHVYLKGLLEIQEFVKNKGDLKLLYTGIVGISHLKLINLLLEEKIMVEPKYLPRVLK